MVEGRIETAKTITVRFSEFEANVTAILAKTTEALGDQEPMVLTDCQGNLIVDSEGTRGKSDNLIYSFHCTSLIAILSPTY